MSTFCRCLVGFKESTLRFAFDDEWIVVRDPPAVQVECLCGVQGGLLAVQHHREGGMGDMEGGNARTRQDWQGFEQRQTFPPSSDVRGERL